MTIFENIFSLQCYFYDFNSQTYIAISYINDKIILFYINRQISYKIIFIYTLNIIHNTFIIIYFHIYKKKNHLIVIFSIKWFMLLFIVCCLLFRIFFNIEVLLFVHYKLIFLLIFFVHFGFYIYKYFCYFSISFFPSFHYLICCRIA